MPYSVQSPMRSSRRYPLLKLLRKHGLSSRQPIRVLRLSRTQNFRGSLQVLKRSRWRRMRFDEFYAKFKDIVNSAFNLGETILEPKIVRKVLRSLPERFHAKITAIEE